MHTHTHTHTHVVNSKVVKGAWYAWYIWYK